MTDSADAESVTDQDIADQLDGTFLVSNAEVSRRLHVHRSRVAGIRKRLGLPTHPPGRPIVYETREQVIALYLLPDGEHLVWTGPVNTRSGTPVVNWSNTVTSVNRALFEQHYGRPPEGYVKATCGMRRCIEPTHLADRRIRAERRAAEDG